MGPLNRKWQTAAARLRLAMRVPLEGETERRNYRNAVIEGALAAITVKVVVTYAPVFAIALGASNQEVGFLYSFPFLLQISTLLIARRFMHRQEWLLPIGQGSGILHRVFIVLFVLAPYMNSLGAWWVLVLYALASASMSVSTVYWQAIVSDMFPQDRRGVVFGTRAMLTSVASLVGVMLCGQLLDAMSYPLNFTVLFILAATLGFIAAYYYGKLEPTFSSDSDGETHPTSRPDRGASSLPLRQLFLTEPGRKFLILVLTVCIFNCGFHMASPLYTIYFVEYLQLSNGIIGFLTALEVLFQVLGSRVWGQLADRFGVGPALVGTTALMAIQAGAFWLVPNVVFLGLMQAVGGFALGGYNIATLQALFLAGDKKHRPQYIVWYNVIVGVANFAGPQLGARLLGKWSITWVFVAAGLVRLSGAFSMAAAARGELAQLARLGRSRRFHKGRSRSIGR